MTKSAENIEKKIEAQLEKLKQLKAQKQARLKTTAKNASNIIEQVLVHKVWLDC